MNITRRGNRLFFKYLLYLFTLHNKKHVIFLSRHLVRDNLKNKIPHVRIYSHYPTIQLFVLFSSQIFSIQLVQVHLQVQFWNFYKIPASRKIKKCSTEDNTSLRPHPIMGSLRILPDYLCTIRTIRLDLIYTL